MQLCCQVAAETWWMQSLVYFLLFVPSWCWQHVCELLSEFFMLRKGVVFNSWTSVASFCVWELCANCRERLKGGMNCLHVSSCSHFLSQVFRLAECPSQSLFPDPVVQLLKPGLLFPQTADKSSCNRTVPIPFAANNLPFALRKMAWVRKFIYVKFL